jgi:hypothetical protein
MVNLKRNNWEFIDLRHELTRHFKVKVYSNSDNGKSNNNLVGYSGLCNLIGDIMAERFIICALMSDDQKIVNKLRRGITITFYAS